MKSSIKNSSDFLFIYEAIQCNPNGDPDQENKPRMDYDTNTNLVTDTRIKRFIRDYLKNHNHEIFVDMVADRKVDMGQRIELIIKELLSAKLDDMKKILDDAQFQLINQIISKSTEKATEDKSNYLDVVWSVLTCTSQAEIKRLKADKHLKQFEKQLKNIYRINLKILAYIVKERFIDIRLFGSAFAIAGFTKPYTGPIQLNWGYSFNKVELIDSSSIVTIMNDDSSTFGKDYRVHYSLLGFNGTINAPAARTTGLSDEDVNEFRKALWESIPANPTRSKLNQYPKVYIEVIYNEGVSNGQFGDLRNFVEVATKTGIAEKQVRKFNDLDVKFDKLVNLLKENKGADKKVKEIIIHTSPDISILL
jgi:CRISPR-associated protein Csh2